MGKANMFFVVLLLGIIQGCATLNKSECRKADWEIIGLEDGSAGRPITYIGRHRKSCAEYGVKPNMSNYRLGHVEGVRIFCTPRKGFELGKAGRSHNDVCPVDLRVSFIAAYDNGKDLFAAKKAMNDTQNRVKSAQQRLDNINDRITNLEGQLVSGNGSTTDRKDWLDQIKQLQVEQNQEKTSLRSLQLQLKKRQRKFKYLSNQIQY